MKPWEAQIPCKPKNKHVKRCYTVWTSRYGGKVVWLTNKQMTFYKIKYPNKIFKEVLDKDTKELYKKYMLQTVD
jgi:hypothetical protein